MVVMSALAPVTSLYVHVPFCAHKCEYCAFFSETPKGDLVERYVQALVREIELVADDLKPRTIFFGGGTPSLLSLKQWERILQKMDQSGLSHAEEWTVECNPATVSLDKARLLKDGGVNRISMGVQSLDEGLLDRLGRVHSREMVFKSYDILRQAGFDNINVDLMFAIPGQTMDIWRATLREATALESEHLSCYEVIYEEDTPLFEQMKAGEFSVDEDLACAMFDELVDFAESRGFRQYEISNFARAGRSAGLRPASPGAISPMDAGTSLPSLACRHNVNYWRGGSFHGLGPAATGYVRGVRTKNWSNTPLYCDQVEKGQRAFEMKEELSPLRRAGETATFGLRMNCGWGFEEFQEITGFDLRTEWAEPMRDLESRGLAIHDAERFRLTREGLRFADTAGELFLK